MQQANGIAHCIIRAQRVGADKLGKAVALMRGCADMWPHFMQYDGHAARGHLPGRLAAGKAAADDVNGRNGCHYGAISAQIIGCQPRATGA